MIAGAVALASVGSYAASANMTVIGTISPEACAITLGSSGAVDFGTLPAGTVKAYSAYAGYYVMPAKNISLDVTCGAPTAVSLSWADNRSSSKPAIDGSDASRFGLGVNGSTNIGAYAVNYSALQVAATTAATPAAPAGALVRARNTTGAWTTATGDSASLFSGVNSTGFKLAASDTAPPALAKITGNLTINALVNKALVDSATSAITLDGNSTVNVDYL